MISNNTVSLLSLLVAFYALTIARSQLGLKRGWDLAGYVRVVTSSVATDESYIHEVHLINNKDRAAVIFAIYLKAVPSAYLLIEDFGDSPLIIAPFSSWSNSYGPVDYHVISMNRVNPPTIDKWLRSRFRIYVSTLDGRIPVTTRKIPWDPIRAYFDNHLLGVAHPIRSTFFGKTLGGRVKHVVQLELRNGEKQILPFYGQEHEYGRYKKLGISEESLTSVDALKQSFLDARANSLIDFVNVSVLDAAVALSESRTEAERRIVTPIDSWPIVYFVGPIMTRLINRRHRKENRQQKERWKVRVSPSNSYYFDERGRRR